MKHDIKTHLAELVRTALTHVAPDQTSADIILERPKQAAHGDFACNAAMQLARALRRNPPANARFTRTLGMSSGMPASFRWAVPLCIVWQRDAVFTGQA